MHRPLRLALVIVAAIVVAVAITLFAVVNSLLQPERFTAMLQQQARQAGLELSVASPAACAWVCSIRVKRSGCSNR